jgi:3-hydroxy-9,10-secoandrosta-1,3,5(10)-triene-9,17-dione monooxygenase reductase component
MSHPPLSRALGRIPSGLFVVTTVANGGPLGFLGSFVQQVGFAPPTVAVAVAAGREHLAAMRASKCFGVSVLDTASKHAMPPFFGKLPPGKSSPFEVLAHRVSAHGPTVLTDALAWFVCRVTGEHAVGDHVVVFGEVVEGELLREGDPSVHLRKNGLSY